ncbi:MAG: hypothetical protein JO205_10635 [Pseudolabrys sp.]|nr:hypothetical protein [Pseudolabrys sp.]
MAIYALLRAENIGPDDAQPLAQAYEAALKQLRLTDRSDPVTRLIAMRLLEVWRTGERDAVRLRERALAEIGIGPGE